MFLIMLLYFDYKLPLIRAWFVLSAYTMWEDNGTKILFVQIKPDKSY